MSSKPNYNRVTADGDENEHINRSDNDQSNSKQGSNSVAIAPVPKPSIYAWIVLIIVILMSICNQWQRYAIGYVKGYKATGDQIGDPKYEITLDYPDFIQYYGVLSGATFSLSYAVCGIFAGVISDKVNRKVFAGLSCILWSTTTLLTGMIDSFKLFFVFRFLLGIFESAFNPCAYGIISDYFHPQYRTTANSLYNGAIYLGGALSSLATIMISGLGWRGTYMLIGSVGIGAGIIGFLFIMEPKRGAFDPPKKETAVKSNVDERSTLQKFFSACQEVVTNPTPRYITIAASCRFFAGYAIGFYMPSYFLQNFPDDKNLYSALNAVVVSLCGFTSALVGGLISDYYEQKGIFMTKAYVCIGGSLLGVPTILLCCLSNKNFPLALTGLALEYLVAESWIGPAITMVLNTISPQNKGFAVSAFLFFATIFGTISTQLLTTFTTHFEVASHPEYYGYGLCLWVSIPYTLSVPFFYLAGRTYTSVKKSEQAAKLRANLIEQFPNEE